MELAVILGIVNTILSTIQFLDKYKALISFPDCKRQLLDLERTVNNVRSVLEDAEAKQDALNSQHRVYIEQLKDAVYDADDVLDEFATLAKREKLTEDNHKLSDKVRSFISRFSSTTRNLSTKVRGVNKKLDATASNSSKFLFKIDDKVTRFTKDETCSFLSTHDKIIGRENDVEKIVEMLLDYNDVDQPDVLSLSIVGMGGLGKTALAQLVYNDPRIARAFQLKCWTCIADQDQWNLECILDDILTELDVGNTHNLTTLEQMQHEVSKELGGKKYLLVLDDVWTEKYNEWQELEKYLMLGGSGSRIVITTRSKKTAQMIDRVRVHELNGLSDDESWRLFKRMAFRSEQRENPDEELVKLGKEIVKKCMNVPLAIKVVGSALRGEPTATCAWRSFRDKELANISHSDDIMNILKLSYHQLHSSLKSCFAYCAIFPKDFVIEKRMLISHWMAQGYINVECEGEEYFHILLQRCFFQDLTEDDVTGEVRRFKIHDLLHDIAVQAAGKEICRLNSDIINVDEKVRHLSLLNDFCPQGPFKKTYIRTCLQVKEGKLGLSSSLKALLANWTCLRSLDLSYFSGHRLPKSIGKLFHLRYLDLTGSHYLEVLPKSITKLVNLQTLILLGCRSLKELPNGIYKLVDLTILDISQCNHLSHMHSNLGMLTNLHTLGQFVVGGESSYEKQCFDGLEVLPSLINLKEVLEICVKVHKNASYIKEDHGGGAYLISKELLNTIFIKFQHRERESIEWEQSLLEDMQPHVNIKHLVLYGYNGETMPRWPKRDDNSTLFYFPNLVILKITSCPKLQLMPSLEILPHLKTLHLKGLSSVEYLVNTSLEAPIWGEGSTFFPCLEQLNIHWLPKLKGWWPGSGKQNEPSPCFAKLEDLCIDECRRLKSIPICSSMKSVKVYDSLRNVEKNNMDLLPQSYKSLLPSDSKSRFMTVTDFERLTFDEPSE